MYFSSIIAISKTRVCFEAFKPTQENIRMCFCHKHSCLEKQTRLSATFYLSSRSCWSPAMGWQCLPCWSVPLLRVQKQWTHHIYMTMYELTNRSAALGPCINFNLQIKRKWSSKWSNILASCVPSWWKQIHMHLQCLPWMHPIWNFSLHRACQAENDNIVRF